LSLNSTTQHQLRGKTVVVTGASAGVGRATVREFARHGARLGLLARSHEGLEEARREAEALGAQAMVIPTDVAHADQVEAAAAQIEEALGPIDVWVNNAMVSVLSPVKDMQPAEYQRVTEVTYLGYVYGTLAALKRMLPRDRGIIIQVGSALAFRSIPLQSAYCAAKHAIKGFTESLRSELIHDGSRVHVTNIQLPAVNTPQFSWIKTRMPRHPQPVPPIYQPEVIARAIVWAARHRRRNLCVGWSACKAILGEKFIPGLLDRYLALIGYASQQTSELINPNRPNNLFKPVATEYRAHGSFDAQAQSSSVQLWLNTHRLLVGTVGLGIGCGLMLKQFLRRKVGSGDTRAF
jgi:NAD(P)-dependent dehydrogenase (short-subunit alcohol dehydrogenase family)